MVRECSCCGYRPARRCAAHRRELLKCEACGRELCPRCLTRMAHERGIEESLEEVGLLGCEVCNAYLCGECFENPNRKVDAGEGQQPG